AWVGRIVKDPALIEALARLSRDGDFEVRRTVAMALADGAKDKRPAADRERCVGVLALLLRDADAHVVAAACRALASYAPPTSIQVQQLIGATNHADFN